eukprot:4466597-Pleurochrysis_carterae.AAC.1
MESTLRPCSRTEGEVLGRLPSTEGLNEVGRAASALQPSGKSDAKRVPAAARGFLEAQTISKQRGEQLLGLRGREWHAMRRGVASRALASSGRQALGERALSPRYPARRRRRGQWA